MNKQQRQAMEMCLKNQLFKYVYDSVLYAKKGAVDNKLSKDFNNTFENIARMIKPSYINLNLHLKLKEDDKNGGIKREKEDYILKKIQEELQNLIKNYEKPKGV